MHSLLLQISVCLFTLCCGIKIPGNFYGSPEVLSGYLPNSDEYVEAFSLQEDCLTIKGNSRQVSKLIGSADPQGKKFF